MHHYRFPHFCLLLALVYLSLSVALQESACPAGNEEEAGGSSTAVHTEGRNADRRSGAGQTGLGESLQ